MLTIQDCIGMSRLTEDEIEAIAEHEHVPGIVAVEIGDTLCGTADGEKRIARYIRDDIEVARRAGDTAHAAQLRMVLKRYLEAHPLGR